MVSAEGSSLTPLEESSVDGSVQLTWWSRAKAEFYMADTYDVKEVDGCLIDALQTFAPQPIHRTCALRLLIVGYNIGCWIADFSEEYSKEYQFIYLTHWSALFSIVYVVASLVCALKPNLVVLEINGEESVGILAKITWELASLTLVSNATVVLMYWSLVYEGGVVTYFNLWLHLLIFVTVIIDALVIGSIPIRVRQFRTVVVFAITYLCWTIIHAIAHIGTGSDDDDIDDAIYEALAWNTSVGSAVFYSFLVAGFVMPLFFFFFHIVSHRFRKTK